MPNDYESFRLVAAHLVKNAHRYYKVEKGCDEEVKNETVSDAKKMKTEDSEDECKNVNKILRENCHFEKAE